MGQIIDLIKTLGISRMIELNYRHSKALPFIRGYAASSCLFTLLKIGFIDDLLQENQIDLKTYCAKNNLDYHLLHAVCEYLDVVKVLKLEGSNCRLQHLGRILMAEPRGVFDLTMGYEPIFENLDAMIEKKRTYGEDIFRDGKYVAKGSGELGLQVPFVVMKDIITKYNIKTFLDLGCGDLEFPFEILKDTDIFCFGIDVDKKAIDYALDRLKDSPHKEKFDIFQADMFELDEFAEKLKSIQAITAIDVFHEYFYKGEQIVVDLIKHLKSLFPDAYVIVAEFCEQGIKTLRKRPTMFLEHHLFHAITNQVILTEEKLLELFEKTGCTLVEKRVFSLVGHGYFVLK